MMFIERQQIAFILSSIRSVSKVMDGDARRSGCVFGFELLGQACDGSGSLYYTTSYIVVLQMAIKRNFNGLLEYG